MEAGTLSGRYETGDRTISIASITDQALDAYLTQHGC